MGQVLIQRSSRDQGWCPSHRTPSIIRYLTKRPLLRPILDAIAIWMSSRKSRSMFLRNSRNWLSVRRDRSLAKAVFSYNSVTRRKNGSSDASSSTFGRISKLYMSAKSLSYLPPGPRPISGPVGDLTVLTICRVLCARLRTFSWADVTSLSRTRASQLTKWNAVAFSWAEIRVGGAARGIHLFPPASVTILNLAAWTKAYQTNSGFSILRMTYLKTS